MVEVKKIPIGVRTLPIKEQPAPITKGEMHGYYVSGGGKRKPKDPYGGVS